jgi:hypothetical protein
MKSKPAEVRLEEKKEEYMYHQLKLVADEDAG